MSRGLIYEIREDGASTVFAETGGSPNGLAQDVHGNVWVAQNGGAHVGSKSSRPAKPGIQRVSRGVTHDILKGKHDAPNDCVIAPDGSLWFTDPAGSPEPEKAEPGRLISMDPSDGRTRILLDSVLYPNGLAFAPSGTDFYLAETATRRILHAKVQGFRLGSMSTFAQLPYGAPDGLATDDDGNLYVAAAYGDSVFVFSPSGQPVETINVPNSGEGPSIVTNVCFGGPSNKILFMTVLKGGRVMAVNREVAGAPVNFGYATRA